MILSIVMNVRTVRALKDNYCYLVTGDQIATRESMSSRVGVGSLAGVGAPAIHRSAVVIDPSDAEPIMIALRDLGLKLGLILNTHHHHDHVGGNLELAEHWQCPIYCSARDFERVPGATRALSDGEMFEFEGVSFEVLAIPGHTEGQIAYRAKNAAKANAKITMVEAPSVGDALFVGDTLFSMGCGRLFEGTPAQMFNSLARIKSLPGSTRLYFGHEYTETNARFAKQVEPENSFAIDDRLVATRSQLTRGLVASKPTLEAECKVNPFLRAKSLEEFTHLRKMRDSFT